MKYSIFTLGSVAIMASTVSSLPVVKKQDIDLVVLQFALTLEHLENVFYKKALARFSEIEFLAAGHSFEYYNNLKYIAHDEEAHVKLLTAGITAAGGTPVEACTYNFPMTNVQSFISLSSMLEGVGTSAYLGGAPLITSKDYLTIAGSILVTEALHTSMQRQALHRVPAANPYGTPLTPTPVYSLAATFIESCPSGNMALGFRAYPSFTTVSSMPAYAGRAIQFSAVSVPPASFFVTFVNGLNVTSVAPERTSGKNVWAVPPVGFGGQTYALITTTNMTGGSFSDSGLLYGPAVVDLIPGSPTFDRSYQK
ncbi:hypothetical protein TWF694_001442 [Orbilia ellipsospora]|uniref:Uncharacterized protein n=1 Tax=Orbilia ellipsospora TaxID=2528407 RepID=A0AAV9XS02_9PEZI